MPHSVDSPRTYRGLSQRDRQATRREALLAAGLEIFGTDGYGHSTVRNICDAAGLNQRYFYESFATREDLLTAVWLRIVAETRDATLTAVLGGATPSERVRAGLWAWWQVMLDDPRKARVLTIEVIGVSESLELRRRELTNAFADFIIGQACEISGRRFSNSRLNMELAARSLVATTLNLVADWMRGDCEYTVEQLVDHTAQMYLLAGEALFPESFSYDSVSV
jgi:AcrR family transcriptional regulator